MKSRRYFSPARGLALTAGIALLAFASCGTGGQAAPDVPIDRFIAITFDDGPFDHTGRLLDILAEHDVRATFFLIGQHIEARPGQARLILEAGHEIGNHSWEHANFSDAEEGAIRQSLERTSGIIREVSGEYPVFFRAPFLVDTPTLRQVAGEMGMSLVGSNVIGMDWGDTTTDEIVANVLGNATDGGIILLHEQFGANDLRTERALPQIFAGLRARGFGIVSLSELLEIKGAVFAPGTLYGSVERSPGDAQ